MQPRSSSFGYVLSVTKQPDSFSNEAGTENGAIVRPCVCASIASRASRTASSPSASEYIAPRDRSARRIKVGRGPRERYVLIGRGGYVRREARPPARLGAHEPGPRHPRPRPY